MVLISYPGEALSSDVKPSPLLGSYHTTTQHKSKVLPVFYFPSAIKIWNNLPEEFISCTSLHQFKAKLAGQFLSNSTVVLFK